MLFISYYYLADYTVPAVGVDDYVEYVWSHLFLMAISFYLRVLIFFFLVDKNKVCVFIEIQINCFNIKQKQSVIWTNVIRSDRKVNFNFQMKLYLLDSIEKDQADDNQTTICKW